MATGTLFLTDPFSAKTKLLKKKKNSELIKVASHWNPREMKANYTRIICYYSEACKSLNFE